MSDQVFQQVWVWYWRLGQGIRNSADLQVVSRLFLSNISLALSSEVLYPPNRSRQSELGDFVRALLQGQPFHLNRLFSCLSPSEM